MTMSPSLRRWLGLIAIALGVALIVVDTTIVNVIVPSIIDDLGIDSAQAQWIQESYAIVFAALLLLVGRISDIVGARRVFVTGVVVFGISSLLAGVATSGELLIGARFLQGVGGALILPTSLALLNATFTGKARGQAFAVWGSTIGAASALGPLLGGWLAEHASWRWAFGINIPLVALILVASLLFIDRSPRVSGRIDSLGAVLSIAGLGLLAFGLIEGRTYGWVASTEPFELFGATWGVGVSVVFVSLALSALSLATFVVRQRALSRGADTNKALMDTRLFSIASFRGGNIATLLIGLGEFGIIAVLPLWLQFTLGYSAVQAGAMLVPIAIGSFVASGASFGLAASLSPLNLVRIGLGLEVVGLAGLGFVAAVDSPWWHIAIVLFFYGIGVGFATAQVTNVVLDDVPTASAGQGSGIQSAFRQLGSALGIAVLTTTFFTTLGSQVRDSLTGVPDAEMLARSITDSAGGAIAGFASLPETEFVADAARDAMTHGVNLGGFIAAGFVAFGLLATALIPNRPAQSVPRSDAHEDVAA
ncbi:MFS transporter [Rhodococcus sp. 05-339-2]|uniref:DHA2 family efflux MFS transporter permease subunit n=1 Tax=Rhodococcoides fascians TaxID=1828 RepID=UPI00050C337D|nr:MULTISPECIES: DHA2 family efflux MFS transporter permease subunit [Rhodococcus]OZD84779.1 MFS transporter [Rhodococcus sp. 05-339-2]